MLEDYDAIQISPVSSERWADIERLFGPRGACAGCWCMYWRLPQGQFEAQSGEGNRQAFQQVVASGKPVGLLAYVNGEPVGWCAVAPREEYPKLERSRVLARVDEQIVWSVTCFFVARKFRRQGLTVRMLRAAIEYAAQHGASLLEGYPIAPKKEKAPDAFVYTGLVSAFEQAGFSEVARRSETRPIMRYQIGTGKSSGSE